MPHWFSQQFLFGLLGGLGLFLFGMKLLADALQQLAGERLRKTLSALTTNRVIGAFVGLSATALLQASSATTIMVVGFVNAGLLSLVQGIGVVLGANLGTALTTQLIAFKIAPLALPAIAVGVGCMRFARRPLWRAAGGLVLGFGILFLGLSIMKEAFVPLRSSLEFQDTLLAIGDHRLAWVLVGALLTLATQSSGATIGLTIALATSGFLSVAAGVALILGENIGSTITTNLAAIGTNLTARRTALAHFLFNLVGVVLVLLCYSAFLHLVATLSPGDANFVIQTEEQSLRLGGAIGDKPFIARHIANSHTLFNVINLLIFLPLVGSLAKLTTLLIRGQENTTASQLNFIDVRVLNTPSIAISQARSEVRRMAHHASAVVAETIQFLQDADRRRLPQLAQQEEILDLLQRQITDFLAALAQKPISAETSRNIVVLMQIVNDLERIGDHCQYLCTRGRKQLERGIVFSTTAALELKEIADATQSLLDFVLAALEDNDLTILNAAKVRAEEVERLEERHRSSHMARLGTGECSVQPGLIFIDMLHSFEKIAAHSYSIAAAHCGSR